MSSNPKIKVAHLDDLDRRGRDIPVRELFGIRAFGANAFTPGENGTLIGDHDEAGSGQEELYVVLDGNATFEIDGETVDAPQGTLVFVPPAGNRTAFAEEPGTTVLAVGSVVGHAYEAGGWEVWAEFHPAYEAGEYEQVADRAREPLEATQYATPLYNLACCEALAGRKEDAIGHLRTAVERRPGLRELAKEDTDFESLRDEPAFAELVGA